jgi:hypothetical protein
MPRSKTERVQSPDVESTFEGDCPMKKIEEYRAHADECRVLAGRSRTSLDREMLLNMAATWDGLADGRAKTMETQQRLAKLKDQ